MKPATLSLLTASLMTVGTFPALPAIEGDITGDLYGPARAVQGVQTQFGDNLSELNAAYAKFDTANLHLAFTGNLEANFNKLVVFVDSVAGGQNTISAANNPSNFDSQIGSAANGWESPLGGTVFDAGFEADYVFLFRRGAGKFDFDYAQMGQTAIDADEFVDIFGGFEEGDSASFAPITGVNHTFEVGYNNANTAGVMGGTQAADTAAALAVSTGVEILIPLGAIGNPTGPIKVTAFVSSGSFDFNSNQFLGSLELEDFDMDPGTPPDRGNVGNFFGIDQLPGEQFFTIINGDSDGDGDLDNSDLQVAISNFNGPGGSGKGVGEGNTDDDGDVDNTDLQTAISNFTGPNEVAVPEPVSAAMLAAGGLLFTRRRRRA